MLVDALFAGKPKAFGPRQSPSSIIKRPFEQLHIEIDGAIEDEQGNKKLHGGPEMALHQFSQESYVVLQNEFTAIAEKLAIGSIGENISAPLMNDRNVFIGDTYRIGSVIIQVNSPRAPCVKINQRYGFQNIDLFIGEQGITGWYFRVIETGIMNVGDEIKLEYRLQNTKSIAEIMRLVREKGSPSSEKLDAAKINGLAAEWRRKLTKST
ncbi:MOSC domain-containing protein [Glaciecola sp. MF2-115]|uniref:MOSC domain-containing protein n=1 Tax=Glaciecola sp. MF2-115 TaxID=3384827 RepID=UPI0039A14C73